MTPEDRRKARARNSRPLLSDEERAARARARERERKVNKNGTISVPVKIGEQVIGRANLHESGAIIFRVNEGEIGQQLFGLAKNKLLLEIQIGASIIPVIGGNDG